MVTVARSRAALVFALLFLIAGVVLIYQRSGILSWLGLALGAGLFLKVIVRPSKQDLWLCLVLPALWCAAWAAIFYYVIYTWEAGEVVELSVELPTGTHTARTWIMERPEALLIYYDAPSKAAEVLVAGGALAVTRGGESLPFDRYSAVLADSMPQDEADQVLALMAAQYGDKNDAADIFYGFLGRARDRAGVVVTIPKETGKR